MDDCPYLLTVDEITETCVGAEGKRWYHVKWKSSWISEEVISPKIFQKTQNGKVHISGNNMIYELLDEKRTESGHLDFLLSCKDSWESEEHLKRSFNPAISIYWASKNKAEELIKIEETSDDEGQTCCVLRNKRRPIAHVALTSVTSPVTIKDERDIGRRKSCSDNVITVISSDVDIPMQELNLSTVNVQSFDSNIPNIQESLSTVLSTLSTTPPLPTNISSHGDVKSEKSTRINSCSARSFDPETNENDKPLSPSMFPIENSCLADACDLPADRFSPKILKIEDVFSNQCDSQSTSETPLIIPDLSNTYPSILNPTSERSEPIPADVTKSNSLHNNHALDLLCYTSSAKRHTEVIKIEDNDEPNSCAHRSLPSEHKQIPYNGPGPPLSNPININSEHIPSSIAQITCKIEQDDYEDTNNGRSAIPPYPLLNDQNTNIPNVFNVSSDLSTSGQVPQSMCKPENKFNSSCQQGQSTRSMTDNHIPECATSSGCCCTPPEKPPLLIPAPVLRAPSVPRYGSNLSTERNENRLCHHKQMMPYSPSNNVNDRRLPMVNNLDTNKKCDICGQQFTDFNALYQHRLTHGNTHFGPPMIKIKEEKDLDYPSNSEGNVLKDSPREMICSNQGPYFSPGDPRIPNIPNVPLNVSRGEEVYHPNMAMKQTRQFNPRIPNPQSFRFQGNCNVPSNHMIYSSQNQFDPSMNPHQAANKNKDIFFPNRMKPPTNPKQFIPEQLHGVTNAYKPPGQREIPPSTRDSYMAVNGHDVPPHPYSNNTVPNHRQMGINPDEARIRMNEPVNVPFCSSNSYMMMNDHVMSMPPTMCKPGEYSHCHDRIQLQQHRHRLQNSGAVRPLQSNPVKDHLFHPGPGPYMASNRHMHPNNFPQAPGDKQQVGQQHMQMPQNPAQMRYQSISAVTNRQFYPPQNQQYFPPNSHLNTHMSNNLPPTLGTIPENFSPNHNDIQSIQQHNGSRIDRQISPPNYLKCNLCGKQFPNYAALREHRATHHMNTPINGPRVQIKEEVDTDYMPISNSNYQNNEYMYSDQNPYLSRNTHRHPLNPANPPNDFPNNVCKQEGPIAIPNPQIPLGTHSVNSNGVYTMHQNENVPRLHPEQQHTFLTNPEASINPNTSMGDASQMASLQNPYLLANGHIIPVTNYSSNNCKTENSNNIISIPQTTQDPLIPTSIQNPNTNPVAEKTHKCDTCGETYTDYSKLKEHRKTHASEKQFSCELCDKTFTQNSTLKRHQRTHTREKPYKCEICGKSFSHNYNLKEHGKTHTGEKPYRCDICGKTFAQNYHLKEHQTTHSDAKPFKCDKCNKQFSLDSYLKKHQKIHTGEKPYKCDVCDKQFLQNSHLKDHRRIHTGEKPFKCEICAIRFSQNYTLKIHQRTHTGEKPYKCEICEKRFSQNSHLKEHRTRTHSGDKPFKCDQCHKEFSLDSYLKKHQKIHSGEKPFKCDICEKQFSQNYHLKEHRRIHTGEKPYKCQICEMRFSQNCSLKIHQRIHTGEKPYECEICGKQFSHSSNVKTHKRVHLTEKMKANVNPSVVSVSYPISTDSKVNILPTVPEIPQPVIATS